MKLERRVVGRDKPEIIENAEAIVLLMHNDKGVYSFMVGPKNLVHKSFVECALRWPTMADWEEETQQKIVDVLEPNVSVDASMVYYVSKELVTGEYKTRGAGKVSFAIKDVNTDEGISRPLKISGIDDAIIALWSDGKALVASDGWGSEKKELMFYGAEVLFGPGTAYQLREAVLGRRKIDLGDNEIAQIDLSEIHKKSLEMWRTHKAEPREIILSAEMWEKLAEERAKRKAIAPSLN